jgi:hypothetical protein
MKMHRRDCAFEAECKEQGVLCTTAPSKTTKETALEKRARMKQLRQAKKVRDNNVAPTKNAEKGKNEEATKGEKVNSVVVRETGTAGEGGGSNVKNNERSAARVGAAGETTEAAGTTGEAAASNGNGSGTNQAVREDDDIASRGDDNWGSPHDHSISSKRLSAEEGNAALRALESSDEEELSESLDSHSHSRRRLVMNSSGGGDASKKRSGSNLLLEENDKSYVGRRLAKNFDGEIYHGESGDQFIILRLFLH